MKVGNGTKWLYKPEKQYKHTHVIFLLAYPACNVVQLLIQKMFTGQAATKVCIFSPHPPGIIENPKMVKKKTTQVFKIIQRNGEGCNYIIVIFFMV